MCVCYGVGQPFLVLILFAECGVWTPCWYCKPHVVRPFSHARLLFTSLVVLVEAGIPSSLPKKHEACKASLALTSRVASLCSSNGK